MEESRQSYYLVVGLGSSGLSMARFLHAKGKQVVATDIDGSRTKAEKILNQLGIETQIGFHDQKTFDLAHTIVVSPGIALDMIYLKTAAEKGITITGELDIFSRYNKTPVIAITGTNGKTTTTTMIRDMLEACGVRTFMGGNIGTPLVEHLMDDQKVDMIVAEISSFQLDLASNFTPQIALLLNVAEDHLDRYKGFDKYLESKWKILKNQTSHDIAIINQSVAEFETRIAKVSSQIFSFSSLSDSKIPQDKLQGSARICDDHILIQIKDSLHNISTKTLGQLPGIHNRENIAAAALASLMAGGNMEGIIKALANFKNLAHRMAFVRKVNGICFYDDSKATNTNAVVRALESFQKDIILILGGREKGTDFSLLACQIKKRVKLIIAMGEAKHHIQDTLGKTCRILPVNSMKKAVIKAYEDACPGDVVLLSPACASFDMYANYGTRGDDFIARVKELENE
ncbi:MAG: UDP-N-acetylmuramoyl-L-alanine--D-glutamate ligase [Desulfobacteraceae bacterium]|nr:UDP-N-acetylmuramoyl-L-alanine--D-glutamate ligase [Desulfobacteraceae bacterium]